MTDSRKISDHFNGKKFFNTENSRTPTLGDVVKLLWNYKAETWPRDRTTQHTPRVAQAVAAEHAVITFVNHSTMLVQMHGLNILTDPVWSKRASPVQWAGPIRHRQPGLKFSALPPIDVVVVSHNHYDHMDIATLKKLSERDGPRIFVAMGDKALAERHGLKNVQEMDWWESANVDVNGKTAAITYTPSQHFSARTPFDRDHSLWGGYMISYDGLKIYFGGDTGYSGAFKQIRSRLGAPDIALIPIGAYEPRWFMHMAHMNPAEAVQAHLDLQAKKSIAIHFGTFALTEESPERAIADLQIALQSKNIAHDDFIVMGEGETRHF